MPEKRVVKYHNRSLGLSIVALFIIKSTLYNIIKRIFNWSTEEDKLIERGEKSKLSKINSSLAFHFQSGQIFSMSKKDSVNRLGIEAVSEGKNWSLRWARVADVRGCVLRLHNAVVNVSRCRPQQRARNENTSTNRGPNITRERTVRTVQNQGRLDRRGRFIVFLLLLLWIFGSPILSVNLSFT